VIEGLLSTSAPFLAVMDADLQHDESILPAMLKRLREEEIDVVVASRHVEGGGMGEFSSDRVALSNLGRALGRRLCHADVSDPMSGFFALRREYFHQVVHQLSGVGFKILLDLLASARRPVRLAEVGYVFRPRRAGASKLDVVVGLEYLELLLDKAAGGSVPVGYLLFGLVGAAGVGFNFTVAALVAAAGVSFAWAQVCGALSTITFNYFLNNSLTFRALRMRGAALWRGLLGFHVACSIGLAAQLAVALSLKEHGLPAALATLAGVVIGSVWNYSMSAIFVWRVRRRVGTL
jgi:dolichol-phosphate mannosyltransferase